MSIQIQKISDLPPLDTGFKDNDLFLVTRPNGTDYQSYKCSCLSVIQKVSDSITMQRLPIITDSSKLPSDNNVLSVASAGITKDILNRCDNITQNYLNKESESNSTVKGQVTFSKIPKMSIDATENNDIVNYKFLKHYCDYNITHPSQFACLSFQNILRTRFNFTTSKDVDVVNPSNAYYESEVKFGEDNKIKNSGIILYNVQHDSLVSVIGYNTEFNVFQTLCFSCDGDVGDMRDQNAYITEKALKLNTFLGYSSETQGAFSIYLQEGSNLYISYDKMTTKINGKYVIYPKVSDFIQGSELNHFIEIVETYA